MEQFVFKSYCYGTAFWYGLRGACRIYDPKMVIGWFRPPVQRHFQPNDLEIYNVWNDGWCLITLAGILLTLASAVPSRSSSPAGEQPRKISPSISNSILLWTVFHHISTAYGAYQHYKLDSHYNTSMSIGVHANWFLALAGLSAVFFANSGMPAKQQQQQKIRTT